MKPQRAETNTTPLGLRVPVPEGAPRHFSTATVVLDETVLLTSWVEGRATYRLGILDLRDGQWQVMTGMRGVLRDALALTGGRALVLTDHALTEIDLASRTVTRQLTSKIGTHNTYLRPEGDEAIAVGNPRAAMESLVSLSDLAVTKRRRRAPVAPTQTPPGAVPAGAARLLASTEQFAIVATDAREAAPQRLLMLQGADHSEALAVDFPFGLHSARVVADGVIVAAADIGQARTLTAIPDAIAPGSASKTLSLSDLVAAANGSAETLLRTRAKRSAPRTLYRDRRLEPGEELADVSARRGTL